MKYKKLIIVFIVGLISTFIVIACSSGSDGDTSTPSGLNPVAKIESTVFVMKGNAVNLDASQSYDPDGIVEVYNWSLVSSPDGSSTSVISPNAQITSFITDQSGSYIIQLTVTDNQGLSSNSTVTVEAATEITENILSDTTWNVENSPYMITKEPLQIDYDVNLTINAGVKVYGDYPIKIGYDGDNTLEVYGGLYIEGNETNPVTISDVVFRSGGLDTIIDINNSVILDGRFLHGAIIGIFNLRNSDLTLSFQIAYSGLTQASYIEKNIFRKYGLGFWSYVDFQVYVLNNVFVGVPGDPTYNQELYIRSTVNLMIQNNSFLDVSNLALKYEDGDGTLDATNNYWGTTDTAVIDSMIYDSNDDININVDVNYLPILSAPHPNTPVP